MTKDWPWYQVKAALEERSLTVSDVARAAGLPIASVAMTKNRPYATGQAAIAKALGKKPKEIWPSRYRHDGGPVVPAIWLKTSTVLAGRHVQKRKAA